MKKDKKQIVNLKAENTTLVSKNLELEEEVAALTTYKEVNQRELDVAMARLDKIAENMGPLVANKEPGPLKEVERVEPIIQAPDSSLPEKNDTAGGKTGDSDGVIESLKASEARPQRERRRIKSKR